MSTPPTPLGSSDFSSAELQRYARHLALPGVGEAGQRRFKEARVLLVGAGGLGSPAALYLAAAGVGTIGLVDDDVVDVSNLQRQVLHGTAAVGRSKVESAAARLLDLNPGVTLERHATRLTSANALDILRGFDVIIDGSDNFPTRYLVNDACVLLGKPDVYGAILRFEGQVSVFGKGGPCYRCLYREPPPPHLVPSCEEAGVLGVLPGIIGSIQALEAMKLILGVGEPLVGRLLLFDGLRLVTRELQLTRDPECPVCGEHPTVTQLIDYEAFCEGKAAARESVREPDLSVRDLAQLRASAAAPLQIVDVREPWEWALAHLDGARRIPLRELSRRLGELDPKTEIVTLCHHGTRSARAAAILREAGFRRVRNLRGGIDAWSREVDPSLPRY